MATVCGFGQIPDLACKSLCCYGRVVLDRNCDLSVANANIDSILTVDVGGNVNFPSTTINMKNSFIDFTGSSIIGFTGNITGNLTIMELEILGNLTANHIFANSICAANIKGQLTGDVIGDLCGNLTVKTIEPKFGDSIRLTGNLEGNLLGNLYGFSFGTHCGPVITNSISEKSPGGGINVTGNLIGTHVGTICATGGVFTDVINEKTPGAGITITGNLNALQVNVDEFSGNLSGMFCGNVTTNSIEPKDSEVVIASGGTVRIPNTLTAGAIVVTTLSVDDITALSSSTVRVFGNLCPDILLTGKIQEKVPGNGINVCGNLIATEITATDLLVTGNLFIVGNINTNLANLVVANFIGNLIGDVCGNIKTHKIQEKVASAGIDVMGDVRFSNGIVSSSNFVGNFCGGIITSNITAKNADGNIDIYGNLTLHSTFSADILLGNVIVGSHLKANTVSIFDIPPNKVLFTDQYNKIAYDTDFEYNSITNTILLSGTQVLTEQQNGVDDIIVSASNLTGSTSGTADGAFESTGDSSTNNNFEECKQQINNLVNDITEIKTQLNKLLSRLRIHGLISGIEV